MGSHTLYLAIAIISIGLIVGHPLLVTLFNSLTSDNDLEDEAEDDLESPLEEKEMSLERSVYMHKRTGRLVEVLKSKVSTYVEVHYDHNKKLEFEHGLPENFNKNFESLDLN